MDLIDLLQSQLSGNVLDQLSNQIGEEKEKTEVATSGIISMLTAALAKNAASPGGASALASALDTDHDGSILDNIGDLLGGNLTNNRAANGAGILRHVLGGKQGNAIDAISKMSGLNSAKTGNLMTMLAPIVLGMLGKQKRETNMDQSGLSDMLSRSVKSATNQRQEMGLLGKLLDRDGDGSVMDDIAGMGMKTLGNLFRKR
jgi:Uncharacterized conserved protein